MKMVIILDHNGLLQSQIRSVASLNRLYPFIKPLQTWKKTEFEIFFLNPYVTNYSLSPLHYLAIQFTFC